MPSQILTRALRSFWRERAFSIPAVLTIAVGVGATTAVASLAYAILLRPFPYPEPNELVRVYSVLTEEDGARRNVSLYDIHDFNERASLVGDFGAYTEYDTQFRGASGAIAATTAQLNQEALRAIAVEPMLGRLFDPIEDEVGGPVHKAILSHSLWTEAFGADPDILGKAVESTMTAFEVVGVMPPGFAFPDRADIWLPMESFYALDLDAYQQRQRDQRWYATVARLESGATIEQAQAEMDGIAAALAAEYPETNTGVQIELVPLREAEMGTARPYAIILMLGVALLLAMCLLNVGNLFVVRALARRQQVAVRAALGADQLTMLRGPLAESVGLCSVGGLLGAGLAAMALGSFVRLLPDSLPTWLSPELDAGTLVFCVSLTLLVGVSLGAVPAWMGSRVDLVDALRAGDRSATGTMRGRTLLIFAEIVLCFVLVAGAAALTLSVRGMQRADHGFASDNLLVARFLGGEMATGGRTERAAAYAQRLERVVGELEQLPGVSHAAATNRVPYSGGQLRQGRLRVEGFGDDELRFVLPVAGADVSPSFFATMGIPILRGRDFDESDTGDSQPVVIINQVAARELFGDQDPLGRMVQWGDTVGPTNPYCRVIGVVGDVKLSAMESDTIELYYPLTQWPVFNGHFVARTELPEAEMAAAVRDVVRATDPDTAIVSIRPMDDRIDETLWQRRLWSALFSGFAAVAALLATVGLYGLLSYSIAARRRELGVRLALGAVPGQVASLVARDGLRLAGLGIIVGGFGAVAAIRFIGSLLEGLVEPGWQLYVLVGAGVLAVGLISSIWPAIRAAHIHPTSALRD